jgi:hypothetical protein
LCGVPRFAHVMIRENVPEVDKAAT